jgi:hypothetical protein
VQGMGECGSAIDRRRVQEELQERIVRASKLHVCVRRDENAKEAELLQAEGAAIGLDQIRGPENE